MSDSAVTTIIVARKTSALRTHRKLVRKSFNEQDIPVDTGKLETCARAFVNRQNSPLLRLPAEMRNRIYTMVLQADCIIIRSRQLTAFDMTVALGSCCSSISPTHSQTWREGNPVTMLPVICRQLYEETQGLLYALNTFAFVDDQSMRVWISCRTQCQRKQIRSLKLPGIATNYYTSSQNISLVAVFPQLRVLYIDLWRVVARENELEGLNQKDIVQLQVAEKAKVRNKEGNSVDIVATECAYVSTILGGFLDAV